MYDENSQFKTPTRPYTYYSFPMDQDKIGDSFVDVSEYFDGDDDDDDDDEEEEDDDDDKISSNSSSSRTDTKVESIIQKRVGRTRNEQDIED
jgi:hypothetical protein